MRIDESRISRMSLDELMQARSALSRLLSVVETRLAVPEDVGASQRPPAPPRVPPKVTDRTLAVRLKSARSALAQPGSDPAVVERARRVRADMERTAR